MLDYIDIGDRLITDFLTEIRDELVAYMKNENRNATGRSSDSLQLRNITKSTGQLVGNEGIEFVFRGRGPGKFPPLSAIIDWCNARGLPRAMAWAVARKIAIAGTQLHRQGRNVLNEIITPEKIDKLTQQILVTFTAQVRSEIKYIIAV
jgi:hypothetical protein